MLLVRRDEERRVGHAERREDAAAHEVGQALPAQPLDDRALHVHRQAVAPARPRLIGERQCRQPRDHVVEVACLEHAGFAVQFLYTVCRRAERDAVREAGAVGHQFAHGRGVDGRFEDRFAVGILPSEDLCACQFGEMLRDRVLGRPQPLIMEDHHRGAGDRLGHREDAEDGVLGQRLARSQVLQTHGAQAGDLAVARAQRHRAGQHARIDLRLYRGVDRVEPGTGQAKLFGRRALHQISPERAMLPRWCALGLGVRAKVS